MKNRLHYYLPTIMVALLLVAGCVTNPIDPPVEGPSSARESAPSEGLSPDRPSAEPELPPESPQAPAQTEATDAETDEPARLAAVIEPEPKPELDLPRHTSIIATDDIVAYYGHPHNSYMGILGENPMDIAARNLRVLAAEYDSHNGDRGVVPAFHIIYATAHPDAEVTLLDDQTALEYIEYGQQHGLAVILDHQLGRHDTAAAIETMLPFLHYPNVHFAIDPEWATDKPGQEIGSVSAEAVNRAQSVMQDYLQQHSLPGKRLLVVHQFRDFMIADRASLRIDFDQVELIHDADGFGPPEDKYKTWNAIFTSDHPPHKGFKLFLPKQWRDFGYDDPLLTPSEVLALRPRPVLIIYQ